MRKKVCVVMLVFFLFPAITCGEDGWFNTYRGRVMRILDGDTMVVRKGDNSRVIRLWGIDTPEKGQPFSRSAKLYTVKRLRNRWVTILPLYIDDYDRLVARVWVNESSVEEELVSQGLAWVHEFYCRTKICIDWNKLQLKAKEERRGVWSQQDPIPPWIWKDNDRQDN